MKLRLVSRLLILVVMAQVIGQAQELKSPKPTTNGKKAQALVETLAQEDYAKATKDFNDEVKNKITVAKLEHIWTLLLGQAGPFKKQVSTESSKAKEQDQHYEVVIVKCQFERATVNVRVVFDAANQVAGLFFAPA